MAEASVACLYKRWCADGASYHNRTKQGGNQRAKIEGYQDCQKRREKRPPFAHASLGLPGGIAVLYT